MNADDLPDLDELFGTPDSLTVPLDACPRCEGKHEAVTFKPFTTCGEHTHWATCPETGEPVLVTFLFA